MRRTHLLLLLGLVVLLSPLQTAAAEVTSVVGRSTAYELHRQGERDFANRHDVTSESR